MDLDEGRPAARAVRRLASAHAVGEADIAVVAISASERQRDGGLINNFQEFLCRLETLGLRHLEILRPPLYFGISFWDWSIWANEESTQLEQRIHDILCPHVEFIKASPGVPGTPIDPLHVDSRFVADGGKLAVWAVRDRFPSSRPNSLTRPPAPNSSFATAGRPASYARAASVAGPLACGRGLTLSNALAADDRRR